MLQRVSFRVAATEVEGILHLPSGSAAGGVAVLADGDAAGDAPHVIAACEALAGTGVAALRFSYRPGEDRPMRAATALADAGGAI
ncbi:MAG: hypothetical protein M3O91_03760, partial [Chloroflexota bacterium]|nr:hypothetical protein [Chloroflexota bacterium]